MKRQLYLISCLLLLLSACKDRSQNKNTGEDAINIVKEASNAGQKKLQNKIPLNRQELEDTFPFRIGNYERDFLEVSEDLANAQGSFGDSKIHLKITDGAGPMGQVITMFNAIYNQKEPENSAAKKTVRNGQKIIEHHYTENNQSSIEFIYIDRFHVFLEGKQMTPDELWNLFEFDNYLSSLQVLDDYDNKNIDRNH